MPRSETCFYYWGFLSTMGNDNPVGSWPDYTAKAKYSISPIVNQYREGKVKSRGVTPVK